MPYRCARASQHRYGGAKIATAKARLDIFSVVSPAVENPPAILHIRRAAPLGALAFELAHGAPAFLGSFLLREKILITQRAWIIGAPGRLTGGGRSC